jgi:hypothetical protein
MSGQSAGFVQRRPRSVLTTENTDLHGCDESPVRQHVRASAAQLGKSLPRESAQNHNLLRKAVRVNTRREVGMRSSAAAPRLFDNCCISQKGQQ